MLVDSKAVEKLAKKDKGLFNKIKEFITNFFNKIIAKYKKLAPTSVEARLVQEIEGMSEKLQKLFEDALVTASENQRIVGANSIANSPAKMEIKKDINGNTFVDVTEDILVDAPLGEKLSVTLAKIISDKFHNIIKANGQTFRINSDTNREWRRSPYSQKLLRKNEYDIYRNKQKALFNADELLVSARNWIGEKNEHPREDDIKEFARGEVWFRVPDGTGYLADILVATKLDDSALLYDILNLKEIKITEGSTTDSSKNSLRISNTSVTDESVSHDFTNVNTKFQLKANDTDYMSAVESGDMATAQRLVYEAAERKFKDSKARDSEGKLVKVYHGTEAGNFNKFDKGRQGQTDSSLWGRGYYFTSEYDFAEMFGDNVRSFFLNITNPFTVSKVDAPASEIADKLMALGEEIDFDYSELKAHEFAKAFGNQRFSDVLASHGYDGVIVGGVQSGYAEYVAFEQNQMKLSDPVTYDDNGNVIHLSERFDDKKVDIRFQKKQTSINTDYSDLSKLDAESLRVYNNRGWARSLLTKEDNALLNRRLGEIFHENSKYVRTTLADGTVVLDLNNKMLLVSGKKLGQEVIHGVVAISATSETYGDYIKGVIYDEIENYRYDGETIKHLFNTLQRVSEEDDIRFYDADHYHYNRGQHDNGERATLPDNWQNYGYTTDKQDGRGVPAETENGLPRGILNYQLKSYAVKTDRELLAQHLEENSQAVGEMCYVFFVYFLSRKTLLLHIKKIVKTSNLQTLLTFSVGI